MREERRGHRMIMRGGNDENTVEIMRKTDVRYGEARGMRCWKDESSRWGRMKYFVGE